MSCIDSMNQSSDPRIAFGQAAIPETSFKSEGEGKRFLSLDEVTEQSFELGRQISTMSPPPEIVIGLESGGTLPAIVAAGAAGLVVRLVKVRRKSSSIKQKLRFLVRPLRRMPGLMRCRPIRALTRRFDLAFGQIDETVGGNDLDWVSDKHVVIVDDCIDSGATVAHIFGQLEKNRAASVRVAVLGWGKKFDSKKEHGIEPDIYLDRIIHLYPWSLNNPEYPMFKAWLDGQDLDSART